MTQAKTNLVDSLSGWVMPVVVALLVALIGWISKIDDRQFAQKDIYATKAELAAAIVRMEGAVAKSMSSIERQRSEDNLRYQQDQDRMWQFFGKLEAKMEADDAD